MRYEDEDDAGSEFIFCDGCGARLYATDRTCPKCGRPAPGILSTSSASADLAAGKTASFPRLTVVGGAAAEKRPSSAPEILTDTIDPSKTSVLTAEQLEAAGGQAAEAPQKKRAKRDRDRSEPRELTEEDFARPKRFRWVAPVVVAALVVLCAWFVVEDPLAVMDDFYAAFSEAASEAYPSRYSTTSEDEAADEAGEDGGSDAAVAVEVSDSTLSEAEAYERLCEIYEEIVAFQDQIGDVVDDYNGYYIASDYSKREAASESAYAMREDVQAVLDELEDLELASDSAYLEDVEHLIQLATWMYNRVNVLCESWDISLALDEDESASEHRSEIVQPLRDALDANGVNQDVTQFEAYLSAWAPTEKSSS